MLCNGGTKEDMSAPGWMGVQTGREVRQANPVDQSREVMSTWIASEGEVIDSFFLEKLRCDVTSARTVNGHT